MPGSHPWVSASKPQLADKPRLCPEKRFLCLRPYHPERARSRLISEAKQGRAWLVLGWEKRFLCYASLLARSSMLHNHTSACIKTLLKAFSSMEPFFSFYSRTILSVGALPSGRGRACNMI